MEQGNELAALRVALGPHNRLHRYTVVVLYFLKTRGYWVQPMGWVLRFFWVCGPYMSCFSYQLKSETRDTLLTAKNILMERRMLREKTLDVGCGIGHLPSSISSQKIIHGYL